jgi:hypothetical protein
MSGAAIGLRPTIMLFHLSGIQTAPKKAQEKRRAEVPGGIRSKFHGAQHVPASRPNSNTLIMDFGSSAKGINIAD